MSPAMQAQRVFLPDGRMHLQHGPIDIVIGAEGEARAVAAAHEAAWQRFGEVLSELVGELPALRQPVGVHCPVSGPIARRMWLACRPFASSFITPMAAVAGSVAQELVTFYETEGIERAWVNNGGDVALALAPGRSVRIGLFSDLDRLDARQLVEGLALDGHFEVMHASPVRGVATSGWRGRSASLGIADSVTALSRTAAEADAAATMLANAVNVDDERIVRRPAHTLRDDCDLGDRLVTVQVPLLGRETATRAVDAGLRRARELQAAGLIWSCAISCQGVVATLDAAGPRHERLSQAGHALLAAA